MKSNFSFSGIIFTSLLILAICQPREGFGQEQTTDNTSSTGVAGSSAPPSGSLNFQADLFTGRFTYSVPIKVAPGRQGAQPKLALGYNSSAGNGWCGVGWTLDPGYIQRDIRKGVPILWGNTNIEITSSNFSGGSWNYTYRTNFIPFAQYDDSKGFISSIGGFSSPLVCVSPTNQNPIVYRQQVDTVFLTYNYYTNNYWQVIDKDGNAFYFGEGITNQMENAKTNWPQGVSSSTFRWALDRVVDANGNETFFNYSSIGNTLYLTNILYNANLNSPALPASDEVDFILTNRSDTNIAFNAGYRVTQSQLLSEIDVKAGGSYVRKYKLGYTQSPSTLRSLLHTVTEYGSDYATALPPLTFNYQVEAFKFAPDTNWPTAYSQGDTNWNYIRATDANNDDYVIMADMDGDGLPDRVMRMYNPPYTNYFAIQRNTGSGFAPAVTNYQWGSLDNIQGQTDTQWNSPGCNASGGEVDAGLYDLNGDGYPDRIMRNSPGPFTNWFVQFNTGVEGTNGLSPAQSWAVTAEADSSQWAWRTIKTLYGNDLIDINGDGLPDRVMRDYESPYDTFKVQLNTGNGFTTNLYDWTGLSSQGDTTSTWNTLSQQDSGGDWEIMFIDINGDGLPDRVMRDYNSPYTNFIVQFNNGAGFEPPENWNGLQSGTAETAGFGSAADWGSPICGDTLSTLIDVNGDGLPDRVLWNYTNLNWSIQLNTGSGLAPPIPFYGVDFVPSQTNIVLGTQIVIPAISDEISYRTTTGGNTCTYGDFFDINGDGLPDRVFINSNNQFMVQLNEGPFPDLMCGISNGVGGNAQISYVASTTLDNRNTNWVSDPWAEGTRSLLPFNVWVVSQIVANDGMGNSSTNSYAFKGGYYNTSEREFRGFSQCTVTDPLGTKTTTYFHQSGGRDNSALGEYMDQGSESKKGMPFRVEVVGNDGKTNRITLNKVEEVLLNTNGWYFPYISQTIVMDYEGLSSYRAVAKQFAYDTNTENLVMEVNLGEVTNVVFQGQTFTDIDNDSVYSWIAYANIGYIIDRPTDTKTTSDSAGLNRLRETQMTYNSRGQEITAQVWLNTENTFITAAEDTYDQYGNNTQTTDAAGITTTTVYDSVCEQYAIASITGTFTNSCTYDIRNGAVVTATDVNGLITSNAYDVFLRPIASYISTNAFGSPSLWQSRTYYTLGGIVNGISSNGICSQVNDAVDPVNGYQTFTYSDGLGRTIETRSEAETGQYRVANTLYDLRGNPYYSTISYFSSGTNYTILNGTYLGSLIEYDDVGRSFRVTPSVQGVFNSSGQPQSITPTGGDAGSPMGPATTAFLDGGNPWATVVTDSEGKTKKSYRDAYGRTTMITEVTSNGNYNTTYNYDLLGNPTGVTDNAGNSTTMVYDSLGRKTSMTDPDMGTWSYSYDNAGRMTQQTDARNNTIKFLYSDQLGRLTSKQIYNASGSLVGTIGYTYDISDDPNYTVFKGDLYKVTDLQGYERSSYDIRGRVLKTGRYLNLNGMEYTIQATYDDADRVQTLTYPGNVASLNYTYDTGGNLSQVRSLSGTGIQEIFYTPLGFNAQGQMIAYTNGNGVISTNIYYANSTRLQRVQVYKGTNYLQDLSYTYDTVSDLKSIGDGVYTGGASASVTNILYDDLYRVASLNSTARGVKGYAYDSIGNTLTNQDFGSGIYQYGAKPHAVTSANGVNYAYDACGNMITRGNQTLSYDEQNQLIKVATTNDLVTFGYDDDGERLWRCGTNGYAIWIGGLYEVNNGKVLCHVIADGQLVASFEPICGGPWAKAIGEDHWYVISGSVRSFVVWPFQKGRGQWTLFAGTWMGILGVCLFGGRKIRLKRYEIRKAFNARLLWRQAVTIAFISAFLWNSTGDAQVVTYSPVFYYYYSNNLGSSNVMTDRSGNLVQHYEYGTFGQTTYQNNTSAFPVSNRYTGQIADDETGLYYYGARYYDPQLGRFIQPDTEVQSPDDPQTLNRYAYCGNNPLNYTDPSGNDFGLSFLVYVIVAAIVGGSVGDIVATDTGGNPGMGFLGGAVAGFFTGVGLEGVGQLIGCCQAVGGAIGGAVGGASDAAIEGGNIGMGALIGGISGAIAGGLDGPDDNSTSGQSGFLEGPNGSMHGYISTGRLPGGLNPVLLKQVEDWMAAQDAAAAGKDLLTAGQASAAGGAATAAANAVENGSIGEPSLVVSIIPVIGDLGEFAHFASTGQWGWATAYAVMAGLDFSGVGEVGDIALKMALRATEKATAKAAAEQSGAYMLKFKSGRMYIGKGLSSRMEKSISRLEKVTGDKVDSKIHYPAANSKAAFIKEYKLMKSTGQLPLRLDPNSKLYNKIWSPGKSLSGE